MNVGMYVNTQLISHSMTRTFLTKGCSLQNCFVACSFRSALPQSVMRDGLLDLPSVNYCNVCQTSNDCISLPILLFSSIAICLLHVVPYTLLYRLYDFLLQPLAYILLIIWLFYLLSLLSTTVRNIYIACN